MPKRPVVKPHLQPAELEARLQASGDAVERLRCQVIIMISSGSSTRQVAESTGYSIPWVRRLVQQYNEKGPACLADRRHANPGAAPLLTVAQQEELASALRGPAPDGGAWNSRKVAEWITSRTGQFAYPQRGWVYWRRLAPLEGEDGLAQAAD